MCVCINKKFLALKWPLVGIWPISSSSQLCELMTNWTTTTDLSLINEVCMLHECALFLLPDLCAQVKMSDYSYSGSYFWGFIHCQAKKVAANAAAVTNFCSFLVAHNKPTHTLNWSFARLFASFHICSLSFVSLAMCAWKLAHKFVRSHTSRLHSIYHAVLLLLLLFVILPSIRPNNYTLCSRISPTVHYDCLSWQK